MPATIMAWPMVIAGMARSYNQEQYTFRGNAASSLQ